MIMKTVDGALPVFEMRRDSDADFEDQANLVAEEEAPRDSEANEEALEEPGEEDEFDDVGTDEPPKSRLPASLAAMPPPPIPSTSPMIAIKHKVARTMKRAESEIVNSNSVIEELDSSANDDSVLKKRKRKGTGSAVELGANTGSTSNTSRRSSSTKKGSKRDSGSIGPDAPLPPELPSNNDSEDSNGHNAQGMPLPLPLPPPVDMSLSPRTKKRGSGTAGASGSSNHSASLSPERSGSIEDGEVLTDGRSTEQGSLEEDYDLPPPTLGAAGLAEEISNVSFARRTSLAMDGFSTLRDSLDGVDSPIPPPLPSSSPSDGTKRKTLRRRQSSKIGSTNMVRKKLTSSGSFVAGSEGGAAGAGSTSSAAGASPSRRSTVTARPRMMDGILRIVKSMYDADTRATMDTRIFSIEAKEYPENVVYVEEDDEATEDYSVDFPAIKAATIEKLILGLTPESYADPDFNFTFLLSFHAYTTPQKLCELLKCRWNIPKPQKPSKTGVTVDAEAFVKKKLTPIRLRIVNVVKLWVDEHRKSVDNDARDAIEKFIEGTIKPDMPGPAASLLRVLREASAGKDEQIMFDEKPPRPYLPMNVKTTLSILDIHPEELARQITLVDSQLYRKIKPGEFLHSGWTKADKELKSPGILAMINSFNVVSRWVSTQILMQPDLKQRAITLNRVICIAQHCYEYNNFNGVMEIIASLHNSSIHRLYNTWDMLPQKSWDMFENLSLLMNSNAGEGNFHLYRNALRKIIPPLVPYLGVYLTDLIFLNDGNKDFADEAKKMVNFHKMAKISRVVRTITTHQQTPYCLTPVEFIQDFILKGTLLTDDQQYVESCKLEKKVPKSQRTAQQNKTVKKIKVDFKALNISDD